MMTEKDGNKRNTNGTTDQEIPSQDSHPGPPFTSV